LHTNSQRLLLYYDQLRSWLLVAFSIIFFFLLLFYQRKKVQEFAVWYQSGSSFWNWVSLNLSECLIPLLIVTIVFSFLFLFINHVNGTSPNVHLSETHTVNQLFIRFPTTNDALIASIQLTSKEWLSIFFTTLWKTIRTLFLTISLIGLTTLTSYSYWRYRHWNNSSH
jgi:multisubunit Na+/H+ antiporter MnhB subunit